MAVDFIKFLGTAGARFVMIRQLRSSAGLWVSCGGTDCLIDPGPGSIVRCASSRPKLDPSGLEAVILTHRHLDHSNDVNVMIEAMTEGGFKRRGTVFCPKDALEDDPVVLRYARNLVEKVEVLEERKAYSIGGFSFETSMRHIHPVETYGLKFKMGKTRVGLITDTRYFPGLRAFYEVDLLIVSVVFLEPRSGIDHLSFREAAALIREIKPKKTILTHFGMTMLKAHPTELAGQISSETGLEVIAAYDGMTVNF